jgi:hypothetical protein
MPQVTNTYETYDARGIREELSNIIHKTDPEETPFMSLIGTSSISSVHPEWQTDALKAIDLSNNQPEGNQWSYDAITATARVGNYAQISDVKFTISGTLDEIKKAGRGSEVAYQTVKKGIELKIDMEGILLSNQASLAGSGDAATNRKTGGLPTWSESNNDIAGTDGGFDSTTGLTVAFTTGAQRAFSKAILDSVILQTYNSGGNVGRSTFMCSPYVKQVFSSIMDEANVALPRSAYSDSGKNTIVASAELYKSDFGTIPVVPNRQMKRAGATVARYGHLIDPEMLSVGMFRDIRVEKPAKTGDAENRVALCEYALIVKNEAHLGMAGDLYGLTASS